MVTIEEQNICMTEMHSNEYLVEIASPAKTPTTFGNYVKLLAPAPTWIGN
jgi:hypothetical protein